jgi:hypothetical protein
LGYAPFPGGFEHQLEQVQNLAVLDPTGHLPEQQISEEKRRPRDPRR